MNSRAKGARGELELARFLTERGYPARRGQQYAGSPDSPDVVAPDLTPFHLECKRVEAGNPYRWLSQATADAGPEQTPLVCHRRNGQPWLAILRLDDFLTLHALAHGTAPSPDAQRHPLNPVTD